TGAGLPFVIKALINSQAALRYAAFQNLKVSPRWEKTHNMTALANICFDLEAWEDYKWLSAKFGCNRFVLAL
ncbi:MAG: hypothetical protein AAB154_03250, partial [Candidatus Binatota bacterium]